MNGIELKALRKERGLTQIELAAITGVPQSTIASIESGGGDIKKVHVLNALTEYFTLDENKQNTLNEPGMPYLSEKELLLKKIEQLEAAALVDKERIIQLQAQLLKQYENNN